VQRSLQYKQISASAAPYVCDKHGYHRTNCDASIDANIHMRRQACAAWKQLWPALVLRAHHRRKIDMRTYSLAFTLALLLGAVTLALATDQATGAVAFR
jgi:hypothetical protein